MSVRRIFQGAGVIITSPLQLAQIVDAERVRKKMSMNNFVSRTGQVNGILANILTGNSGNLRTSTIFPWFPVLNLELTLGDEVVTTSVQTCQIINDRRIAEGIALFQAKYKNCHSWQRLHAVARGVAIKGKGTDVTLTTVIKAAQYVGLELRLRAKPVVSARHQRLINLGVDPDQVRTVKVRG